ncbi:hypothetical protein D3C75_1061000 [compost metagenome]
MHAAIGQVHRAVEADAVWPLAEIVLPPAAHQLAIAKYHLARLGERIAYFGGGDGARLRVIDPFDGEVRRRGIRAIMVERAHQETDAVR